MKVEDPALFLYVSFDRHLPGHVPTDPRQLALRLLRRFQRACGLTESDPAWRVGRARDVNLDHVDRAGEDLVPWIRRHRPDAGDPLRELVLYSFGDALFLQFLDSLGTVERPERMELAEGWDRLARCPAALLGAKHWERAASGFFGLNAIYSVLYDDETREWPPPEHEVVGSLRAISAAAPFRVDTSLGQLWRVGDEWMPMPVAPDLVGTWVLISPKSRQDRVYPALQLSGMPEPPVLPWLLAGRQKFYAQLSRYEAAKRRVERAARSLDRRVEWMIDTQRDYEEPSRITDSHEMEELRHKSARAHTDLVAFESALAEIRDVQTTLTINLRNYEALTAELRDPDGVDQLFGPERTSMSVDAAQLSYDAEYYRGTRDRARAAMTSADAGFNISQDRQEARQVRLGVVQVSGLFASLMALIVTEAMRLGDLARDRPWFAAKIILLVLAGTFALAQVLQAWRSVRTVLTSSAVGLTVGIAVLLLLDRDAGVWWHYLLGAAASAVAFGGTRLLEEKRRRGAEPAWRKIRETRRVVEKLRRANEEISDLLDDLPTTRLHRLKDDYSFMEKIGRKRAEGRTDYSEIDIADSIGIRYVVSPFRLPIVVDRVERILDRRATEIEYKGGAYKAVHVEVDVLGVGARKDLNLMAEVQVKTHLQHMYATLVHDVLYKDVPSAGGPWWLGIVKGVLRLAKPWRPTRWAADQLLALPAQVEMAIFRRWMRWPRRGEDAIRLPRWRVREIQAEREAEVRRIVDALFTAGNGTIRLVRIGPSPAGRPPA